MRRSTLRDTIIAVLLSSAVGGAIVVSAFAGSSSSRTNATAAPIAPTVQPCVRGLKLDTATDTPTNTPTDTPTPTPTNTPTNTPTDTPTPTPTNTPTNTPTPTPTNTPTKTPTPTPTNTPTNTPTPTPIPAGKVTGGGTGTVNTACGVASFGFNVQRKVADGSVTGSLTYTSPRAGIHLKATSFTFFTVTGTSADFGGACKNNGSPCTFAVHVEDHGESGKTDVFVITINGGAPQGGVLRSGNIQIH